MQVQILDVNSRDEWDQLIQRIPRADVYFTADYCRIYEHHLEGQAQLFVYRQDDDFICYPYLLRDISTLPFMDQLHFGSGAQDITTPYGYGGPICNVQQKERRAELFRQFEHEFDAYCQEQHIVTEFVRFHPLLRNWHDYTAVEPTFSRHTAFIDLSLNEAEICKHYSRNKRNQIRRAREDGLAVQHRSIDEIDDFLALYYATMDHCRAQPYYYFSRSFMERTCAYLAEHIALMEVTFAGEVIVSCLVMHYGDYAHYHLMGLNREKVRYSPVNILVHEAALWAKRLGCKWFHLGGGATGDDSLYRFKREFNERTQAEFYVGRRIRRPDMYQALIERSAHRETGHFFPFYRDPTFLNRYCVT
ncbi:lipid II:glycine glycyltransferase FemX [Paenibacillus sp. 481]|uniref:lipid II:glycine glycyltransferase FemX n=1 Tax=Paenibacillus sp. 481 TaxID=2835869 RepID=UPI001E48D049|nr:GNAT family N-acetyltransferase [Paenibacillus sp. 481]UHA71970.1 GNAT family N-acetyltransferase [Paenibacillus sp. 481]